MTRRPGITLVELMISIAVLGLIVVVVSNLFVSTNQFTRNEQSRIDVGENVVRVFSAMDEAMRQTKNVLASATINGTAYASDSDTFVFSLPSIEGGELASFDIDSGVITLDTSVTGNPRLRLIIEPNALSSRTAVDQIVAEHVKDVYFRYTTAVPADATAATATVVIEKDLNNRAFARTNILYATFRNHP